MVLMEASSVSTGARIVLFCLIGLLLVILGFLIAFAWALRRRPDDAAGRRGVRAAALEVVDGSPARIGADGTLAVEPGGTVACPTCRREYDGHLLYCPRDARRLVPVSDLVETRKRTGSMCTTCKRSFDRGVRYCPHDATELVPGAVYAASEGPEFDVVGDKAKICPQCRCRHDLAATFCSRDGSELVVLN